MYIYFGYIVNKIYYLLINTIRYNIESWFNINKIDLIFFKKFY